MQGFSLIELLIVIVIIGILSSIAYPSYQTHLLKSRRVDGQLALLHLAGNLEKYGLQNNSYQEATIAKLKASSVSSEGYYQLSIIQADSQAYLIAATPVKNQQKDKVCHILAMNSLGQKGKLQGSTFVPDKSCW